MNEPYDRSVVELNTRLRERRQAEHEEALTVLQEEADAWGWENENALRRNL